MSAIIYIAKRNISAGHVIDTEYGLEFLCTQLDPNLMEEKSTVTTLSGVDETTLHNTHEEWTVTIYKINKTDLPLWYEYLASTAASESHTFDAYGDLTTPDNAQTVQRIGSAKLQRRKKKNEFTLQLKYKVIS